MKKVVKLFVLMALVAVAVYAKVPEAQKLCDSEIEKEKPNMQVAEEQCSEVAEYYENKQEYGNAIKYFTKVIEIQKKSKGKEHTDTAISYNSVGGLYYAMGDYPKALK